MFAALSSHSEHHSVFCMLNPVELVPLPYTDPHPTEAFCTTTYSPPRCSPEGSEPSIRPLPVPLDFAETLNDSPLAMLYKRTSRVRAKHAGIEPQRSNTNMYFMARCPLYLQIDACASGQGNEQLRVFPAHSFARSKLVPSAKADSLWSRSPSRHCRAGLLNTLATRVCAWLVPLSVQDSSWETALVLWTKADSF